MRHEGALYIAALAVGLLIAPKQAFAPDLDPQVGGHWASASMSYSLHSDLSADWKTASEAGAAAWTSPIADFSFSRGADFVGIPDAAAIASDSSRVVWYGLIPPVWVLGCAVIITPACTRTLYDAEDHMDDADFVFNILETRLTVQDGYCQNDVFEVDVQSVAAHEFGHTAGLNHLLSDDAVIMSDYVQDCRRTAGQDDINAMNAEYAGHPHP